MEARLQGPCVGIDVSKRHWDMAVAGERRVLRFTTDAAGLAASWPLWSNLARSWSAWKQRGDMSSRCVRHFTSGAFR